jgi:hypothetical protein
MPTPPVSLPENAKVIEVDLVVLLLVTALLLPSVAEFIEVVGGVVSTVQVNDAGEASLFVELSTDKTSKVWVPSVRLAELNCTGLVQALNGVPSSEHSRWSIPTPISVPENSSIRALDLVLLPLVIELLLPSIALLITVVGGTVSIVQSNEDGTGFIFPTLSSALTIKL